MRKKIFIIAGIFVFVAVCVMAACDFTVGRNARGRLYDNVDSIPHRKVGLILGTSPVSIWTRKKNYYFINRIKAGAELYNAGKVDWLVVSGGDYRRSEKRGYDEPVA